MLQCSITDRKLIAPGVVMTKAPHLSPADMVGFGRLATDATLGVTEVVEAVHRQTAFPSGDLDPGSTTGIATLVYNSIRGVTKLVEGGLTVLTPLLPPTKQRRSLPEREALVAALNGVFGDYLARTDNPLAISISLRRNGRPLEIDRDARKADISEPTGKLLLLAHGLCLNDLQWKRKGHDHGAALARELGYTPVYLHYNTGLHVSENGRMLACLLEKLFEQWPLPIEELAIIGHSMGGLVSRSAYQYGTGASHHWPRHLRRLLFLGAPHHGAPLERLGNWVNTLLEISPYSSPFARLGKIRSAGITDMRYGNLLDQDWKGRDRFASAQDIRAPLPLPAGVQCYAIAATRRQTVENPSLDVLGDGLVPVNSALGRHPNPEMNLAFTESHQWIFPNTNHWDLLSHPAVYDRIRRWFT
jgi:pimeloyl-ACP methyl ester carboxylesterase